MLNEAISVLCDFAWGYWGTNWGGGRGGGGKLVKKLIQDFVRAARVVDLVPKFSTFCNLVNDLHWECGN